MKVNEMDKLTKHFEYYFEQKCEKVFHNENDKDLHVDILLFEPNEKYPFYKLVTMGASDFKMNEVPSSLPNRNEYILFLSNNIDINSNEFMWQVNFLAYIAKFAYYENTTVTVGHTIELDPNSHEKFKCGFILFPEIIEDTGILRCNLGLFKKCACLQVMPITEEELSVKLEGGASTLVEHFYPEDGDPIYLANR